MYVGARLGRIDSAEFIARMGDWFRKWSSLFSTSNIYKKQTPSAQWTINCACASARAISCTRSSPGPDYCLQASCFDDGGLSSVLSGRLNFYFGTKVLFSTSVSTTTNQGAQMFTLLLNIQILHSVQAVSRCCPWLFSHYINVEQKESTSQERIGLWGTRRGRRVHPSVSED